MSGIKPDPIFTMDFAYLWFYPLNCENVQIKRRKLNV